MNAVIDDIKKLVFKELDSANKHFPLFQSQHEGYAIIKEEIEEAEDEMNDINLLAKESWYQIKGNTDATNLIKEIEEHAIKLAGEAIQIAAMCKKYDMSLCYDLMLTKEKKEGD